MWWKKYKENEFFFEEKPDEYNYKIIKGYNIFMVSEYNKKYPHLSRTKYIGFLIDKKDAKKFCKEKNRKEIKWRNL